MKVALLGDTHFGARGDSPIFHQFFEDFYKQVFFPYLDEHQIDYVVQLGDVADLLGPRRVANRVERLPHNVRVRRRVQARDQERLGVPSQAVLDQAGEFGLTVRHVRHFG